MPYVKVTDGSVDQYPYTVSALKSENPNTSFPKDISNSTLNEWGVFSVTSSSPPSYDANTQYLTEGTPVLVDGVWTGTWEVNTRTTEEQTIWDNSAITENKAIRNAKLAETDWWALSDTPTITTAQTTYRQALRDITTHSNWPHLEESDWPTEP